MLRRTAAVVAVAGLVAAAGCNLDRLNPNAPTSEQVRTSRAGIVALAVGMQARYASSMSTYRYPGGLITDEMGATQLALQSYKDTEAGVLADTYDAVQAPWNSHYLTVKTAGDVVAAATPALLGDSTSSGMIALAYLLKGMSLGELTQMYQQIIIHPEASTTPTFVDRPTALAYVNALLDSALAQYTAQRPGAEFNSQILAAGFDLPNTIRAMQARYRRIAGDLPGALTAANAVTSGNAVSVMPFSDVAINPMYDLSVRASYVRPRDTLRLVAEANDQRIAYFLTGATVQGNLRPLRSFAHWQTTSSPIALFYPGEILLIKAEALAAAGNVTAAADTVNKVRTKCGLTSNQPQACLPAVALTTQTQVMDEIYRQRRFELFATGLRWEDTRRRGLVGATSAFAKRCWLLYPNSERNTNPNVPSNPPDVSSATCT